MEWGWGLGRTSLADDWLGRLADEQGVSFPRGSSTLSDSCSTVQANHHLLLHSGQLCTHVVYAQTGGTKDN